MATVLDPAKIQELLASQKSRGDYDADLSEFLKSGNPGIEVSLTEGRFAGKKGKNVKTGFDNARKRTNESGKLVHEGGQNVKVILTGDADKGEEEHIYLISVATAAEAETEEA